MRFEFACSKEFKLISKKKENRTVRIRPHYPKNNVDNMVELKSVLNVE